MAAVPFELLAGDGEEALDEVEELDKIRQGKPGGKRRPPGKGGKPDLKQMSEEELEEEILRADGHRFHAAARLLWLWALQDFSKEDAEANLRAIFDRIPAADRGPKWDSQRNAIPKWVVTIYARAAKHLGTFLARLATYLTDDTRWRGAVRYNQFTQTIEVCTPFPPQLGQPIAAYHAVDEIDTLKALIVVNASGFPKATYTDVWRGIMLAAEGQGYHPVQDYLNSLVWDGTPRLVRLFFDYFPGRLPPEDNHTVMIRGKLQPSWHDKWVAYFEATGPCFMMGAVARAMDPGSKVDSLPIFVSGQRYYKGLGLQALTGNPAWFTDDIPVDVVDKDAKDALVGKWICELAEMPHLRRDVERFKAFVSRQSDRYRRSYDRLTKDWPRQSTLVGTSNDLVYLDTTGNRRFWAIPLAGRVNVTKIAEDRDQLWAEATHRWRNEKNWWLSDALEEIAAEIQAGYVDDDLLEVPIEDWIDKRRDSTGVVAPFEMAELYPMLREPLGLGVVGLVAGPTVLSKADQNRVANCLKRLGFHRERRWLGGKIRKAWVEQI